VDGISTTYLDAALADFSGYLAVDEAYDDPFCILSVADNRRYNRLAFRVLDHDPTQDDVLAFLTDFKGQLDRRCLDVPGITTDGSSLYPKVIEKLWPGARHQICRFHVIKEIIAEVLHALAVLRKEMAAQIPTQPRGRPRKEREGQAWLIRYRKRCVAELLEHRYLFVRHHLSPAEQKQLQKLTHGRRQLRALRKIMEEVYRLFDRRCRTQTALKKLQRLRRRVRRFKRLGQALSKLKSPNLEKALEFLDDKLLGATSNAVERANRRFRKAQRSIYCARTKEHLEQRLALDMYREQQAPKRQQTAKTLHRARSRGADSGHP
jgi:transposase-like protein